MIKEYKFRADWPSDVAAFIDNVAINKMVYVKLQYLTLKDWGNNQGVGSIPDVEVEIKSSYTLPQLRKIILDIPDYDLHIMYGTINYKADYTGERDEVVEERYNKKLYDY